MLMVLVARGVLHDVKLIGGGVGGKSWHGGRESNIEVNRRWLRRLIRTSIPKVKSHTGHIFRAEDSSQRTQTCRS